MGVSLLQINGITELDLTKDTVTAESLLSGTTAHDKKGEPITGSLSVQYFRTGASEPSDSLGNDGDLYLVVGN